MCFCFIAGNLIHNETLKIYFSIFKMVVKLKSVLYTFFFSILFYNSIKGILNVI